MSSLTLYRARVPAHASIPNEVVEDWLEEAAAAHTASAWGERYPLAMVWWAAHHIERTPQSGANGSTAEEAGAITSQSDTQSDGAGKSSSLSRSYAVPSGGSAEEQDLRTTRYGQMYLAIRRSRVARAPFAVGPGA